MGWNWQSVTTANSPIIDLVVTEINNAKNYIVANQCASKYNSVRSSYNSSVDSSLCSSNYGGNCGDSGCGSNRTSQNGYCPSNYSGNYSGDNISVYVNS